MQIELSKSGRAVHHYGFRERFTVTRDQDANGRWVWVDLWLFRRRWLWTVRLGD